MVSGTASTSLTVLLLLALNIFAAAYVLLNVFIVSWLMGNLQRIAVRFFHRLRLYFGPRLTGAQLLTGLIGTCATCICVLVLSEARDLPDIILWWILTASIGLITIVVQFLPIARQITKRAPLEFLVGKWFLWALVFLVGWFSHQEAGVELNAIFGLPATDFSAALTVLSAIYVLFGFGVIAVLAMLPIEIVMLAFSLSAVNKRHNFYVVFNFVGIVIIIFIGSKLLLIPSRTEMRSNIAVFFALRYDFDTYNTCVNISADKVHAYKFTDLTRRYVISALAVPDSKLTIKQRAQLAKSKPEESSRSLQELRILACEQRAQSINFESN
jgi:hypothetical protein